MGDGIESMEKWCRAVLDMTERWECQEEGDAFLFREAKANRMHHLCQVLLLWMKTVRSESTGPLQSAVWEEIDNLIQGALDETAREIEEG
jgi:hypothetical protein